jgi:hypothetical protein
MRFQFVSGTAVLTTPVAQGGLGMTAAETSNVRTWQGKMGYVFEFHSGMHGDACVYVNNEARPVGRNVPCIWLEGSKALTWRNKETLAGRDSSDAESVVRANQALFVRFHKAYNT